MLRHSNICPLLSVQLSPSDDSLGSELAYWDYLGGKEEGVHFLSIELCQSGNA